MPSNALLAASLGAVLVLASGCTAYKHVPQSGAAGTAPATVPVNLALAESELKRMPAMSDPETGAYNSDVSRNAFRAGLANALPASGDTGTPPLEIRTELEPVDGGANWLLCIVNIFGLGIMPCPMSHTVEMTTTVSDGNGELFRSTSRSKMKMTTSSVKPLASAFGTIGPAPFTEMAEYAMHQATAQFAPRVQADHEQLQKLAGADIQAWQQWLKDNPDTFFRLQVLERLANNPPRGQALTWHRDNIDSFPAYADFFSEQEQLMFAGSPGNRVIDALIALRQGNDAEIVAARIKRTGGNFPVFDAEQTALLKQMGLPPSVISAMIEAGSSPTVATRATTPSATATRSLLIPNNSGQYMNPWTSDGVLADWVDKAINADIGAATGSAVGAAAGAYAGKKALENVPMGGMLGGFLGGSAGSKAGSAVGRDAAIAASGGEAYIRQTSDQSFRTLEDMATYLSANYAGSANYQAAVKAANAVYPGLLEAMGGL